VVRRPDRLTGQRQVDRVPAEGQTHAAIEVSHLHPPDIGLQQDFWSHGRDAEKLASERHGEVAATGKAGARVLLQCPGQGESDRHGDVRQVCVERFWLSLAMQREERPPVALREEPVPGQQLEGYQRQGILVRTAVAGKSRGLLGRRVGGRAGEPRPVHVPPELARQTQVQHLEQPLLGGPDVVRLQIAVNHPMGVSEIERLRERANDQPDLLQRQPYPALPERAQGLARKVLKHRERHVAMKAVVVHRGDGRVREIGSEARLLGEGRTKRVQAATVQVARPAKQDGFQRHETVEPQVPRQEDHPHAPATSSRSTR
jgi:hypothetical protein